MVLAPPPHPDIAAPSTAVRRGAPLVGWTVLLAAIALGPLFVFRFPGLQDYPNHLARAFILLHRFDPVLERLYSVQWTMLPNLGWDLWAVAVGRILPLEWTGKLFLALSQASILAGCFALNRAVVGRWTLAPLLAVPFLFNSGFTKGFLSFDLGVGVALLATACWVSIDDKHWLWRLLAATLFSTLLYLIHLYAWGCYGIFVGGYELRRLLQRDDRRLPWSSLLRLGRDGLQAVPALTMLGFAARAATPKLTADGFYPLYLRIGQIAHLIDVNEPITSACLVLVMAAMALMLLRRGWLSFHPDLAFPLACCVALFLIVPERIAGTDYVIWRILLMALLGAIASLAPSAEAELGVHRIAGVIMLLTAAIAGLQLWSWRSSETGRQDFLALIRDLPDGSALLVVHGGLTPIQLVRHAVGLYHVGAYAVLAKRALVQSLFVLPGQQPLRFRDPALQAAWADSSNFLAKIAIRYASARPGVGDFRSAVLHFDYVVVHGPEDGRELQLLPAEVLTLVNRVGDFRLYRVAARSSRHARGGVRRATGPAVTCCRISPAAWR